MDAKVVYEIVSMSICEGETDHSNYFLQRVVVAMVDGKAKFVLHREIIAKFLGDPSTQSSIFMEIRDAVKAGVFEIMPNGWSLTDLEVK